MAIYRKGENIHGYYTNTYVVLHTYVYQCEEREDSVYAPSKFAVKPEKITHLKEILNTNDPREYKTTLYFDGDEFSVIEKFDEVIQLIDSYNRSKKHDLIDDENN